MPKRQLPLANNTQSTLVCLVIAAAAFLTVAFATRLASLSLLLIADSACLLIAGRAAGMRRRDGWRGELRGVAAYLAMLTAYTMLGAALVGYPLHWLHNDASLGVVLTISAASVLALLMLWRVWPAFGLTAMDARHRHMSIGRTQQPQGYLAAAWQLTANNEIFFGHGLLASLALLMLAQGALALSGWGASIASDTRPAMLAVYAALVLPLTWVVVQRAAIALLIDGRRLRADHAPIVDAPVLPTMDVNAPLPVIAPVDFDTGDLDAMLLCCVRAGQTQLALAALAHGADPNCVPPADDRDQRSALVLAALNPDIRLLRGFIAKGADLQRVHAGLPVLIAATRDSSEGRVDAVMTLLTNGADANCADADGNTPLHFAALSTKPIVAALLCDAGAYLDSVNREGQTPLARASGAANWELVRFLLERGAKPEVGQSQPALIAAAMIDEDDPQGVKLLLKRKVRVDARDALQRTALMTAALHGHAEIARALIEAGARLDAADAHGTTALMEAARADAHRVLDILMPLRPPPDAIDHAGRSALTIAAQSLRSGEETVRRLLTFGISRQLAAKDGRRAVDFAAAAGRWNIVALIDPDYPRPSNLQDASVAPTAMDSPEHLLDALRFGHWQIVEKFSRKVRHWQPATLARLFVELITHTNAAPRRWLLDHGLDANASLHGMPLLWHALAQLPATLAAANDLVDAGAQAAGGDGLAQICAAAAEHPQADLEAFALRILELGAEKFRADRDGRTPLAQALANGWLRLCETLLAQGADPQARDRRGRTPLFAALSAAEPAREASIKLLLRAGADPEVRAANNETPLGLALARGHANLQRWLNWPGWKLPHRPLRATDAIAAASAGDADAVGKLLELGLPADAVDGFGASPLLHAAGRGHADVVTLLLDRGANPAHAASDGATALSAAVAARQKASVDLLLARGAGIDQPLAGGGTALMAACGRGDIEMAGALLAHSAKADAADAHGMCALHAAAQFAFAGGDVQKARGVFEMLLDAGAPVDARNADGQTALLILLGAHAPPRSGADQKALLGLLEVLRERGARIDVQDERGVSPLHACAMHGLLLPARALLAAGADRSCRDLLERTPREVAHRLGFVDVAAEIAGEPGRRWAI
ncbi:MAG: ankyrin repeat domain-containing protein [Xanthomonadaceae bacterium]|nr:ankyrin repeat domain-containing protein [Xanthomonadaceae bacterium]